MLVGQLPCRLCLFWKIGSSYVVNSRFIGYNASDFCFFKTSRGDGMSSLLEKRRHEAKTRLPELLDEVAFSIKSVHPDSTVILFGSYARGEQNEESDLDICVLVPELTYRRADMEIDAACAIRRGFPLPIDLSLYTFAEFEEKSQKKFLLQYDIKKDGVILHE
jgi:predicted nucleotidyltransferase